MKIEQLIYALVDPRNPTNVKYVGHTIYPLRIRLWNHIASTNSGKKGNVFKWIRKLAEESIRPSIICLEVLQDYKEWKEAEMFYISYYRLRGDALENIYEGGYKTLNRPMPEATRQKISNSLRARAAKFRTPQAQLLAMVQEAK